MRLEQHLRTASQLTPPGPSEIVPFLDLRAASGELEDGIVAVRRRVLDLSEEHVPVGRSRPSVTLSQPVRPFARGGRGRPLDLGQWRESADASIRSLVPQCVGGETVRVIAENADQALNVEVDW